MVTKWFWQWLRNVTIAKSFAFQIIKSNPQNDQIQTLTFEGTYLRLHEPETWAIMFKQNILSIRRWGVGSDDVR